MSIAEQPLRSLPPRTRGGKRVGAGRPPKPVNAMNLSLRADHRIGDHLPQLLSTLIDLAVGEYTEQADPLTGLTRRVYIREPDAQVCLYLTDRIIGQRNE